ncbi:transporter [Pseudomonas aeruginosa]|nr:transporter [Pseudomonas aeruginosa]
MMLGLVLLYVGAVLFLNAVWLLGKISGREVAVINFLVGVLSACVAFYLIFSAVAGQGSLKAGALTLLFAFTYLWVAANQFLEVDGKGLGWFCLFVSLTACTVAIESFAGASGPFGLWSAVNWTVWALLWFCFFLLLGLSRSIQKPVAYLTLASAIFTAWLPGLLLLGQVLKA